jgi:hypothetical protein
MQIYDIKNRMDRCSVLFSYLLSPKFELDARLRLYHLMLESHYFGDFIELYIDSNFLTPEYLQAHTKQVYTYDPDISVAETDVDLFYLKELEYRKQEKITWDLMETLKKPLGSMSLDEFRAEVVSKVDSVKVTNKNIMLDLNGKSEYEERKNAPMGILTGIRALDEDLRGLGYGTLTCIFGYVSSMKSTLALNIAYQAIRNNFNVLFITLEVPKKFMYFQVLSLHSYHESARLGGDPIAYETILKGDMTETEEKFLFEVVEPDFKSNVLGKLFFADADDLGGASYSELVTLCNGFPVEIDGVILDYFQLLIPYINDKNEYLGAIRLGRDFARLALGSAVSKPKIVILVSQVNAKGYEEAIKQGGLYSLKAIAETPGLARDAYYAISTFLDDKLRISREAKICLLKNKSGKVYSTPLVIPVAYECMAMGKNIKNYSTPITPPKLGSVFSGTFDVFKLMSQQ